MKSILMILSLFVISCATGKYNLNNDEIKKYASYQLNCSTKNIKILNIDSDIYQAQGCNKTMDFEQMCPLGPCYLIKK